MSRGEAEHPSEGQSVAVRTVILVATLSAAASPTVVLADVTVLAST